LLAVLHAALGENAKALDALEVPALLA